MMSAPIKECRYNLARFKSSTLVEGTGRNPFKNESEEGGFVANKGTEAANDEYDF